MLPQRYLKGTTQPNSCFLETKNLGLLTKCPDKTVSKSTTWEALQFLPKETITSSNVAADGNESRTGLLQEESLSLLTYATLNFQLIAITDYYD